jgi:HTH-type transcriptional regulator / antitoxin HigA
LQDLTSRHDINEQPWSDLFGLVAGYMHEWELDNQPELKITHLEPHERLKFLMERRGASQYQLAKDGIMSQGNLSNILSGKKGISKDLAKRLAKYLEISMETFI